MDTAQILSTMVTTMLAITNTEFLIDSDITDGEMALAMREN